MIAVATVVFVISIVTTLYVYVTDGTETDRAMIADAY
jgi:hypothetical protein